ncbi:hybrid sensor histidine kinase/response regulator [Acidipila sp. EB88]|uniref:hybrid sensor histidine kinase/response regulator n=1 Tax=Acidipila sp. EB88 TaxID=2305226 RepID=UPI000F5D8DFC|nr:hybrid sensor histidine kinase/response regulator [Acidipila sp. EB88]RRA49398.1 hybrid sensor histidine kinase/response regulator [Acidipila sp. EB88]
MQAPRPLRVLLVEDNEDDAMLLKRHLSKAGFAPEMHRVETSEKMLAALAQPWDCVLADYTLPLFSAPEALAMLKMTDQDIPFIMMSGAISEATAVAAMRAGAHDYVSKQNLTRLGPAIERELAEAASRQHKRVTERALRSSEERFHRLVEASPLALLIADLDGRITYYNGGSERLLGLSRSNPDHEVLLLDRVLECQHNGDTFSPATEGVSPNRQVAETLYARVSKEPGVTWEMQCSHLDGTPLPVLLGGAILNQEETADKVQLAIFLIDLTKQKRSEELLRRTEKLAAAGRLAASIAHEINNPLEAITNCLYLLEQSTLESQQRTFLQMARQELDRVTHITTQTLRFYRQSSRPAKTDIGDLIDSVLTLYEGRIRDHSIQVNRDYRDVPSILALDGEIRQVLANFIGNAVDAMSVCEEPRVLTLRARPRRLRGIKAIRDAQLAPPGALPEASLPRNGNGVPDGLDGVVLLVSDSGGGMNAETLRRLYEPFFSTKGITGTGLGLWVSQEIIAKHHGRVQVRTRQGPTSGTVFRLFFPLAAAMDESANSGNLPTLS